MDKTLEGYLAVMARGGLVSAMPGIVKGMLNVALTDQRVDTAKVTAWVKADDRLLSHVKTVDTDRIRSIIARLGMTKIDDSWLTADWVLEAIRKQHPAVYSLLMGWPAGYAWCGRQVIDIKLKLNELLTVQIT